MSECKIHSFGHTNGNVFCWKCRIAELEAELSKLKDISLDSTLSWQDRHIASFRILNPEALTEEDEPNLAGKVDRAGRIMVDADGNKIPIEDRIFPDAT